MALGRFAVGPQAGILEVETATVQRDSTVTREVQQERFEFVVAADCPTPPPPPSGPLPYVDAIVTEPSHPCVGRPISLVLSGVFRDGCGRVIDAAVNDPFHVELTLKPDVLPDTACTLALTPWRQAFDLGALPSGPHRTDITLHVVELDSSRTSLVHHTYYGSHEFWVFGDCDSVPPPGPGPLPYVILIRIGNGDPCGPAPLCPRDSIPVRVIGVFPSDCYSFRRIQLIPSPILTFPPQPPTVRIIVDDGGCLGRPCVRVDVLWEASVMLPPWYAGEYRLDVQLAQVSCSDTYPPGQLYATQVPLVVSDSCRAAPRCLIPDFAPGPGNLTACNATLSQSHPAELTFLIRPTVALAGLQGEFKLHPSLAQITKIEAIGPAQGMLLNWTATAEGARFVLFAGHGAPIPPWPPGVCPGGVCARGWTVLKVTVELLTRGGIPELTVVTTENLLGSDIAGAAVNVCPPPPCAEVDPRFAPGRALICGERACDFNADGFQDVRDLVLMVRCVNGEGPCPPDVSTRFDCDGDQVFAIPDVICCAHHILLRPPCPDLPCPADSSGMRPEPDVAVSFDTPVAMPNGVDLTVRIAALNRVGGVMLTLEAPIDRYDVIGYEVVPTGNWLTLNEVRDGHVVLGMLDIRGGRQRAVLDNARFTLHLRLRPGAIPGGEVTAVAGEFTGPDGVALGVDLGRPTQTLPGGTGISLSGNHPNPFSVETRFTLEIAAPADVVVGIYDLRGRAVTTLHHGPLAAGPKEFRWDGRNSDRTPVPDGVYFYHASVAGQTLARKLILVRRD